MAKTNYALTLFHVSPHFNFESIAKTGLQTRRDRRGNRRVWLCNSRQLKWAIDHVRDRHQVARVDVWIVARRRNQVIKHREGIFFSLDDIAEDHVCWSADLSRGCPIATMRPCQYME